MRLLCSSRCGSRHAPRKLIQREPHGGAWRCYLLQLPNGLGRPRARRLPSAMQEEVTSPVLFLVLAAAATWLLRRLLPAGACAHCGSGSWVHMGDMKQCSHCGRLFV